MQIQNDASQKCKIYAVSKNFYCNLGFLILKFDIKVYFIRSVKQKKVLLALKVWVHNFDLCGLLLITFVHLL